MTAAYLSGEEEDDALTTQQRFSSKSRHAQQRKMEQTALLRAAEEAASGEIESLPVGQVIQVFSLFYDVEHAGGLRLCVLRKTLSRLLDTAIVVGDFVRFRETGSIDDQGRPEAVIEQLLPRTSILTRSDSFKAIEQHPIVANAEQMLIVASLRDPAVRWGLIDRMLVAAQSGSLRPIICLNKIDLAAAGAPDHQAAEEALGHYQTLGITTLQTSVDQRVGIEALRELLRDRTTVLAGHSGVGKSSLIRAVEPALDLRIGAISGFTGKGRHTTTFARRYPLGFGGYVIDTPGVKLFGLWNITRENAEGFFPDIGSDSAPPWRRESFERILDSLPEPAPGR